MTRSVSARLLAAGLCLPLLGLAACSDADDESASGLPEVTLMMFPAQVYRTPVLVAQQEDFFADEGIEVEIVAQPANLQGTQGLEATGAQVGQIATSTLAQGTQAGADVAFFCGGLEVIQTSLVAPPDSDLPSTEDGASWQEVLQALEGKNVGIQTPVGSGVQLLFAEALEEAGVEDVTYVNVGTDMNVVSGALESGSIDVGQVSPPVLQNLEAAGKAEQLTYLPDGPQSYRDNYGSGWVAPTSWLDEDPESADAFCRAVTRGLEYIRDDANAEAVGAILQEDMGVSAEIADQVLADGVFDDFATDLDPQRVAASVDLYEELGIIEPDPPVDGGAVVRPAAVR